MTLMLQKLLENYVLRDIYDVLCLSRCLATNPATELTNFSDIQNIEKCLHFLTKFLYFLWKLSCLRGDIESKCGMKLGRRRTSSRSNNDNIY